MPVAELASPARSLPGRRPALLLAIGLGLLCLLLLLALAAFALFAHSVTAWGPVRLFTVQQAQARGYPIPARGVQGVDMGSAAFFGPHTHRQTIRLGDVVLEYVWYSR